MNPLNSLAENTSANSTAGTTNMDHSLVLQDSGGLWRHAVDAPVGVAVLVADGDAEAAVVGADHLDGAAAVIAAAAAAAVIAVVVAVDPQFVVLASVGRLVLGAVRALA